MKVLFEEYGRTIIAVIVVVAVLALLIIRLDFFGVLGSVADVNSGISHSQGESALRDVVNRDKPKADFSGVDLHIYNNCGFQPLRNVVFTDAEGATISHDDVIVTSILYCDAEGNPTELVDYYNAEDKIIILNPTHYSSSHTECAMSEFSIDKNNNPVIDDEETRNSPGVVTVTYRATDNEAQVTVAQLTFVIDDKPATVAS